MSFEQLYKAYWGKVFRLCLSFFNDYDLAQDLAQDVFVREWKYLPTLKEETSVGTWIFRIATNVCLRQCEYEKRIPQTTAVSVEMLRDESADNNTVQALLNAISELPEIDRLIISLYLEEMKQSEISQIIGISETNVRVRVHRIKSILAKKIAANEK